MAGTAIQTGYISFEPNVLREPVYDTPVEIFPLPTGTELFGATFMADQLEIPLEDPEVELYLMGQNVPGINQMFMTAQF